MNAEVLFLNNSTSCKNKLLNKLTNKNRFKKMKNVGKNFMSKVKIK
jgi:hypothetical protein